MRQRSGYQVGAASTFRGESVAEGAVASVDSFAEFRGSHVLSVDDGAE